MSEKAERPIIDKFPGRVGLQQRVLPGYRVSFFDALSEVCGDGLEVFVGQPVDGEGITTGNELDKAQIKFSRNRHFLNPSSSLYLCWQEGMLNWLKTWEPDVLILEANPRYISSYLAIRHMKKKDKPLIGWGLGAPNKGGIAGALLGWERKMFFNEFDALISYSHQGANEYQRIGFPSKNIYIAPNAVAHRSTTPLPEKIENKDKKPVVLFVGRLQARKRIDLLIQACSNLPADLQPWLMIIGDGPARFDLENLAGKFYPKTEFLGPVYGPDLIPIYALADLFVLPGTGGLAVQEAMANGLPVIVAQGDGTQGELVRPENGWQIPPNNVQALQNTLEEALSDIDALQRKGMESFHIVQREINIENMVAVFLQALNSVL